jgi:hypothetical protein
MVGSRADARSAAAAAALDPPRPRVEAPAAPGVPDKPKPAEEPSPAGEATEALRFPSEGFTPAGLAYDAVSGRFIVADRDERKLIVIGERSQRVSNLVGAESGGFGEIGGIAIDARQGDLWVASTSSDDRVGARLHKLQLISGRHLTTIATDPVTPPARFVDVAVAADGGVLALDGLGRRVFRQAPSLLSNTGLLRVAALDLAAPSSIAPAPDGVLYVAHAEGVSRVELQSNASVRVAAPKGVSLQGLTWIRWHGGRLVGVQRSGDGQRIVRIRLDRGGTAAARVDVLQRGVSVAGGSAVSITGDTLYYLTSVPAPGDTVLHVVRRIDLK